MTENRLPPADEEAGQTQRPFPQTVDQLAWMLLPGFVSTYHSILLNGYVEAAKHGRVAMPNGAGGNIVQVDLKHAPWTDSELEEVAIKLAYRTAHRMLKYGVACANAGQMPGLAAVPLLATAPPQG